MIIGKAKLSKRISRSQSRRNLCVAEMLESRQLLAATISMSNVNALEGNSGTTPFVFTVTLSEASAQTVSLTYQTRNDLGSATPGSDYTAIPATTLTFTPGQTSKTITVNVMGDTAVESDESFFVF